VTRTVQSEHSRLPRPDTESSQSKFLQSARKGKTMYVKNRSIHCRPGEDARFVPTSARRGGLRVLEDRRQRERMRELAERIDTAAAAILGRQAGERARRSSLTSESPPIGRPRRDSASRCKNKPSEPGRAPRVTAWSCGRVTRA
jgi:hypothetical protein